tara:strand:- start:81 stop:755 length:675 start_codon:yes stop_codon:yes gene_type:complete
MPETIYMVDTGPNEDGHIQKYSPTWAVSRSATTGTTVSDSGSSSIYAIRTEIQSMGRGGATCFISRAFFQFNVEGIRTRPNSAKLMIYGAGNGDGRVNCVKALDSMPYLSTSDFDNIDGWVNTSDGLGTGNNASNVTYYASELGAWSTSGYNEFLLNDTALNDLGYSGTFAVCLLDRYDLRDLSIGAGNSNINGVWYSENTGTSKDPKIEYEPGTPSVFFGANF